jgi:pimeloyl-ACP methyl ester carboxylesterase
MRKIKLQMQISVVANSFLFLVFMTGHGYAQQNSSAKNKTSDNTEIKNNVAMDTLKAYIKLSNGLKMYYEIQGTGQPVIVLHGGFGNTELYMPNVTALEKNYKVVRIDMQGHGRTADIDRPLDYDSIANDIAEFIKQLNLGKTNIVGYSLGGSVALRLAIKHPELLQKVVLISCPFKRKGWFPDLLVQQDQMGQASAEVLKQTPMYQSYLKMAPKPEDWTEFVIKMSVALQKDYDWSKEVETIKLPVLLMCADADAVMPGHMIEFFKLLGGGLKDAGWQGTGRPVSELAIIPGETHYTLFMSPALSNAIMPFLNKK